MAMTGVPLLDPREEHFHIPSPRDGLQLFLRYLPASGLPDGGRRPVLYVHRATFLLGDDVAPMPP